MPEKKAYAERAGTTIRYAQKVFAPGGVGFQLRSGLVISFAEASDGQVTLDEAIDYFLVQPVRKLAAEMGSTAPSRTSTSVKLGAWRGEMKRSDTCQKPSVSGQMM